jgi:hypothetical protein
MLFYCANPLTFSNIGSLIKVQNMQTTHRAFGSAAVFVRQQPK